MTAQIQGACLCGAVQWRFSGQPEGATACNCTACRRYGVLWAYDHEDEGIHVSGPTRAYVRGKALEFHFCPTCGCVAFWRGLRLDEQGRRRIAVNLRLAEPDAVARIPIDHFDGLDTFDDLPRDGRCVADYWFCPCTLLTPPMSRKPVSDTWEHGSRYERYVGRWSRQVAPLFLSWLNVPGGRRWLDVGCGTGALCAAIADRCSPVSVTGVEPSEGFLATASEHLAGRVALHQGNASAIPLGDASVDVVVSGLVLNFVPDPRAALLEMTRVAGPGGTIAAYVWDYAGRMELMRHFWDVAGALDPVAAKIDEGVRFPLCRPDALENLFAGAALEEVEVKAIDVPTLFANFDNYWQPFLGGQGPARRPTR